MKEQSSLGQWLGEKCHREHLSLRQAAARAGLLQEAEAIAGIVIGTVVAYLIRRWWFRGDLADRMIKTLKEE